MMMQGLTSWFQIARRHQLLRDSITLLAGSGSAKLLAIAITPVLTRIYSPADFGVLAVFNAFVMVLVPIATLRFGVALPLPRSERIGQSLLLLCFLILLSFCLLLFVVMSVSRASTAQIFHLPQQYGLLVPVAVGFIAGYDTLVMWATRQRRFSKIARTQIWQALVGVSMKVGLGLIGLKPIGLLLGQMAQQGSGAVTLLRGVQKFDVGRALVGVPVVARKYVNFPLFRMPSQFLLAAASQAPLFVASAFFGSSVTGQLGLAFTAVGVPMSLVAQTVSNAYYGRIAALGKGRPQEILRESKQLIKVLVIVTGVLVLALVIVAPSLFAFCFGERWRLAGEFGRLLVVSSGLQMIVAPLMHIFNVFEKHREFLKISLWRCLVLSAAFAIAIGLRTTPIELIGLYSLSMALFYLSVMRKSMRLLGARET